jgi:hypothetical protein
LFKKGGIFVTDTEIIDYPVSPTYAGWVTAEHDRWATHIAPLRHQRYDETREPPKPVTPRLYSGISERDMLTPKQIAVLDQALALRMKEAKVASVLPVPPQPSRNDFHL